MPVEPLEAVRPPARTAVHLKWRPENASDTPLPVALPGESCTNVYSGLPLTATWRRPSERMTIPTVPAPAPADGIPEASVRGFQIDVHAPAQAGLPLASRSELYSGIPRESTRTLPTPAIDFTETVRWVVLDGVELAEPPPQADTARLGASTAQGARSGVIRDLRSPTGRGTPARRAGGQRGAEA